VPRYLARRVRRAVHRVKHLRLIDLTPLRTFTRAELVEFQAALRSCGGIQTTTERVIDRLITRRCREDKLRRTYAARRELEDTARHCPREVCSKEHVMVKIKRAYEPPARRDGYRVLIDRLWPRGVRKDALSLDAWTKDVAPSHVLRRWFAHDPRRWREFVARYRRELHAPSARAALEDLARRATTGTVTLIYAARDEEHNDAVVLRGMIKQRARSRAK
jgi:uncharacterized protein YeaO (DUF488 family)